MRGVVVPNCLEERWIQARDEVAAQAGTGELRLLTVSRLDRSEKMKGVDTTLKALSTVKGSVRTRYRIVGDGDGRFGLQRQAEALGLDNVEFLGALDDEALRAEYRAADVFVLPSGKEGFGRVFLEASAAGCALIGARAGGIPEVVADGETGVLVDYGDSAALASAIVRLFQQPDECRKMGRRGQVRVARHFSDEAFRAGWKGALDLAAGQE